jgi:hypothetical protein
MIHLYSFQCCAFFVQDGRPGYARAQGTRPLFMVGAGGFEPPGYTRAQGGRTHLQERIYLTAFCGAVQCPFPGKKELNFSFSAARYWKRFCATIKRTK